jgi:hypothetical protein
VVNRGPERQLRSLRHVELRCPPVPLAISGITGSRRGNSTLEDREGGAQGSLRGSAVDFLRRNAPTLTEYRSPKSLILRLQSVP